MRFPETPLSTPGSDPLLTGLLLAAGVVLACALGWALERAVFEAVATRLWRSSLSGDAELRGTRGLFASTFDKALHVISSGPFKAPFGASVVLLAFSARLPTSLATGALLLLWVLRCASTAQTHAETPLVERWRAEHGVVRVDPGRWPHATLRRLARGTHKAIGAFEHEDLRSYLVLVLLLLAADPAMPPETLGALDAAAFLLSAVVLYDAARALALRLARSLSRAYALTAASDRPPSDLPPPTRGRLARVGLTAFALGAATTTPLARSVPHLTIVLPAVALGALVAAQVLCLVGLVVDREGRVVTPLAPGERLLLSPAAMRRARFRHDVGAGVAGRGTSLPLLWVRLRSLIEGVGFAAAVRASSRADLLITGLVLATLLL